MQHAPWMYWVGVITAGMTAFYVWRAVLDDLLRAIIAATGIRTNRPSSMLGPLVVLAVLSLVGGFLFNVPQILERHVPARRRSRTNMMLMVHLGRRRPGRHRDSLITCTSSTQELPDTIASSLGGLYTLVYNKYFVDEIYDATVVNPMIDGSSTVLWHGVDQGVIDGIVNGVGHAVAGHRQRSAAAAVRQHPKLRDLGGARLGRAAHRHGRGWEVRR